MRLFIAVDLDDKLKTNVLNVQNRIRQSGADVKFVEPENLHFTLKFLGEVEEAELPEIEKRISDVLEGVKRFVIKIEGFGYFGSPGYIRTLWLDVKDGKEQLQGIAESLNRALDYIRHEKRKSNVHLTIGRVKSAKNKDALIHEIEALRNVKIGEMKVKTVKLKQSILTKQGPVYKDVKVFDLTNGR